MSAKLGELLVNKKLITDDQLNKGIAEQKKNGGKIGTILIKMGFVNENNLLHFLSEQYGAPAIKLSEFEINPEVLKIIPPEIASKYQIMPLSVKNSSLTVAMVDPSNIFALDDIRFLTGYRVEPLIASEEAVLNAVDTYYGTTTAGLDNLLAGFDTEDVEFVEDEEGPDASALQQESEDAPVIRLVNAILTDAITKNSSDIHVEPYEKSFRVRYRLDGVLITEKKMPNILG